MIRRGPVLVLMSLLLLVLSGACGGGGGLKGAPSKDGEYTVRPGSVSYDGDRYQLFWEDKDGQYRELSGKGLKMVKDERTFLAREKGDTVLHLREDEPVEVLAQDNNGNYSSPWFPFLLGTVVGNAISGPRYHYPPTATFGRGDQLNGSVVTQTAKPPKYEGLAPNPNAVSGQAQGTGGGNAVTNRAGDGAATGQSGSAAVSGQAQGTGTGAAATAKGGFRSGADSFERQASRPSVGSGAGSRAEPGKSAPSRPKAPAGGGSRGGSRGGGRSGGK